ncbi:hypothetical protein CVM52_06070 [Pseudooceanicola lipolyticus]|uniref:DUF4175 domain-containing protein n=1 Tax=Pseudooceanicola lipolyticus TaxID=2029104 RepID=A0A2M8J448_9RHOB|nr:hypothetical protein [Pseudooceanicola lipolyticus]MCC0022578.1 hypothetical protein [Nitratireductor sp.]PJE37559.1 hypothetical protein CVM52_06070 [Pseudooceanicola lipolyticus]
MTLILLAISLSIALCVIAFNFAIYALPVMTGIAAFQYVHLDGRGFAFSVLAALAAAVLSIGFVVAVLGFAKNPFLRLAALGLFAAPAAVAGFSLAHGVAKNAMDPGLALNLLCGVSGLFVAVAAMINLNAVGKDVLSRV